MSHSRNQHIRVPILEALGHYEAALRVRPDWPELTAFVAKIKAGAPPK